MPDGLQPGQVQALVRVLNCCPDPIGLFSRLCGEGVKPDTLLLESGDTSTVQGSKSVLVTRSALRASCRGRQVQVSALNMNGQSLLPWLADRLSESAEVTRQEGSLRVDFPPPPGASEEARLHAASPIDVLRSMACSFELLGAEQKMGPLVTGVFSWDLLESYESLPPAREDLLQWPDYEFWLPDQMVWLQHRQRKAVILTHVFGGEHATGVYHDATNAIADITRVVESQPDDELALRLAQSDSGLDVEVDLDDASYAAVVEKLQGHIRAGDVFQIVPSRTFSMKCAGPLQAYRRLRLLNPSPYMFFINATQGKLFGASPETAVKVDGLPPLVEIRPIAGTRPRGLREDGSIDPDLDGRMEADLRLNEKEVAEHMMLVDLARNDVARVSRPGTRRVDRLLSVDRYSHVMHLVSYVSGELRDDLDGLDAYVATMNMGTLVGAPKIRAAELLREVELDRRGPYGGAVGYFGMDGSMDTAIVIRSAVVRDGVAYVRAGAGVVYDSEPLAEADETRRKAEAVLQAIRQANGGGV